MNSEGVRFYAGGYPATIQGERVRLTGRRCFSAAHRLRDTEPLGNVDAILDSGAFTDAPAQRLTPAAALDRQLAWERTARNRCGAIGWRAEAIVSYDELIDEQELEGRRVKQRWTVADGERAVANTVEAARFLATRRRELQPRRLVLSCQGVDAAQYHRCCREILNFATPNDWIGLGGWCILGRWKSWLPVFHETIRLCVPDIAETHIGRIHIFGVLWEPALAPLLWLCDQHGITLSCDSAAPLRACMNGNLVKGGARCADFRGNVEWWRTHLAGLRTSRHYQAPARNAQQLGLFD